MAHVTYHTEHRDGCVLLFAEGGGLPVSAFAALTAMLPRGAVMDTHLARLTGATVAAGLPYDLERLAVSPAIQLAALERAKRHAAGYELPDCALEWLALGQHGASSESIFQHLTGLSLLRADDPVMSRPADPADLRRCLLLLEQVPAFKARFTEMATASPAWAEMVPVWDELTALFMQECPTWRSPSQVSRAAPRTYTRMKELRARH